MLLNEETSKKSQESKKIREEIDKSFDELKDKKENILLSHFNKVVHAIYKIPAEDIATETPNIFRIIRYCITVGVPFIIHPALGLVGYIVDKVIEEKINEKYQVQVMNHCKKELANLDRDIEATKDLKEKERLRDYRRVLESNKSKLERYYIDITSYKNNEEEEEYEEEPEVQKGKSKGKGDPDDFEDMFDDMDDFDFMESANFDIRAINETVEEYNIRKFNEGLNELILIVENYENLSENIPHAVKRGYQKVDRANRRISNKIDDTANSILFKINKMNSQKVREEILNGNIRVSSIIKKAIVIGGTYAINPAIAVITAAVFLATSGKMKIREKNKLLADLKDELEIVEEKLRDADNDGNKKKKYEYMRLRTELKRSIDKLRYNDTLREN